MLARVCLVLLLAASPLLHAADTVAFDSGGRKVRLLELYTSEGCSSCPPADRWLSGLTDDQRLWREVVPVAFHVDYWDYIGWRDRFASPEFSARQRRYQREGHIGTVYTPGLVLDGEEWRSWFAFPVLRLGSAEDPGRLHVAVVDGTVEAAFEPASTEARAGPLVINVALLGFGVESEVRAGENEGRRLRHDFVVLGYDHAPMMPSAAFRAARIALPRSAEHATRHALAAWVSRNADQRPVQAVGGWLD